MNTISVIISVRNAENTLARTLESVKWVDEVIVVNNSSTDKTAQIAKKYTKFIYERPNNPMLNVNKNFGFSKANSDWLLSLDSDEVLTKENIDEIKDILRTQRDIDGYWIPRKNIIFGKWIQHGLWWPDKQLRLFKKGKGIFPEKHVHEYLAIEGKTGDLSVPFIHYNYDSVNQFINKMQYYTDSEVDKLTAASYDLSWFDAVRFPLSDFVKIFFAQECYKDGFHGLVLSLLQSYYSLIVFVKLWERAKFREIDINLDQINREFRRTGKEIKYWELTVNIKHSSNIIEKLVYKIKRKFLTSV